MSASSLTPADADAPVVRELQPALAFPPELLLKAQGPALGLRAAIFDVDGVLTDGRIYLSAQGGIVPIVITGRDSPAVRRRVADLGLPHAVYGARNKLAAAQPLLDQIGLRWEQVAVIGDDWPDLPLMVRAGFACAPAQAHAEVKAAAHHVTAAAGGHGAAREFCDLLLMAAGQYARLLHGHLETLDGSGH